jgi:hypothetical protein
MEEIAASESNRSGETTPASPAEIPEVFELEPFERFVCVMSVFERYSDQDCSVLLGCALRDVITARIHSLQQIEVRPIRKELRLGSH